MIQVCLEGSTDVSWWEAGHGRQTLLPNKTFLLGADYSDSPSAGSTDHLANSKLKLSEGQDIQPCCTKLFLQKEWQLHEIAQSDIL